jgi:proteasome lid subunit RPN8/RPN11
MSEESTSLDAAPALPLEIPREIYDAMVAHCKRDAPLEACGLLCGNAPRVSLVYPLRNEAQSETRYFADATELFRANEDRRAKGTEILAIYHSHPRWAAVPSRTDLATNGYGPLPQIIVSLMAERPEMRMWRLDANSYEELSWTVLEP